MSQDEMAITFTAEMAIRAGNAIDAATPSLTCSPTDTNMLDCSSDTITNNETPKTGFFDLPAELRNDIYDLLTDPIDSGPDKIYCHHPLAQVNQQIRYEYLSRYYVQYTPKITYDPRPSIGWQIQDPEVQWIYQPFRNLRSFLQTFGPSRVPLFRSLQISSVHWDVNIGLERDFRMEVGRMASRKKPDVERFPVPRGLVRDLKDWERMWLKEREDGTVCMTRHGLEDLMKCLRWHDRRGPRYRR